MSSDYFDLWKRAQDCIAQGALTNSKHPARHVLGVYPTHISHGRGASLIDHNGRRYLDYICGLGANLFGYGNTRALDQRVLLDGFSHSLPTHHEVEAAEALKQLFYFVDKFKFLKTGSEACAASLRMARAYTGREVVVSQAYHGWSDDFVSLTPPARGVPKRDCMRTLTDNNLGELDFSDVAAVILEPVITDYSPERGAFLQKLRDKCTKHGTVLIFDEVITGFRFPGYSVSRYFNILPDLIVIGKAMSNGLPLAAVGGKADIMDGDYFVSSTYAGEILSLAACKKVVELLVAGPQSYRIESLWDAGERFIQKFNAIAGQRIKLEAYPTRGIFKGTDIDKALFFQEAAKANILLCGSWFYNFPLVDHDFYFFSFLKNFIKRLIDDTLTLEGDMPISPFAEKARNGK